MAIIRRADSGLQSPITFESMFGSVHNGTSLLCRSVAPGLVVKGARYLGLEPRPQASSGGAMGT